MQVGFCGLGLMGKPMVRRLLAAGHKVMVWNRTLSRSHELEAEGATVARSPKDLADNCTHIMLCLFDWAATEEVIFGANGLVNGKAVKHVIDHSSIPVDKTIEFAQQLQASTGACWTDAPVSGGVAGAEQGTLAIMAGGNANAIAEVIPVLKAYAQRVTHMGDVGTGQATKLCNQTIVATTIAAIAEAVAMAEKNGVNAAQLNTALAGGWADSVLLQTFVPRMTSPEVVTTATINTILKDLDTAASLAREGHVPLPIGGASQQLYRLASIAGLGLQDVSQLIKLYKNQVH